jgi:transcriptional regulator with XRE-family HTH domain
MDATHLRQLRKAARLTQLELSQLTGIDRAKLSFAECGYVELTGLEVAEVRKAVASAAESNIARVRRALVQGNVHEVAV